MLLRHDLRQRRGERPVCSRGEGHLHRRLQVLRKSNDVVKSVIEGRPLRQQVLRKTSLKFSLFKSGPLLFVGSVQLGDLSSQVKNISVQINDVCHASRVLLFRLVEREGEVTVLLPELDFNVSALAFNFS